jgi:predicted DNA-binding transcriptional regulator AlpA
MACRTFFLVRDRAIGAYRQYMKPIHSSPDSLNEFMDDKALARKLGLVPETLQLWRRKGTGPAFLKLGRAVRYRVRDIEAWLEAQTIGAAGSPE